MKNLASLLMATLLVALGNTHSAAQSSYTVTMQGGTGIAGATIDVPFLVEVAPATAPVRGYSFSFLNPDEQLSPVQVDLGPALQGMNGGSGPTHLYIETHDDPGGTGISCGTIFDFFGLESLGPGTHHAMTMVWQVDATASATSTLTFCDCLGTPPIQSLVVAQGQDYVPNFESATITISSGYVFSRGDANNDTSYNLADPVYTLSYLFNSGPGGCLAAMDTDGDDSVNLGDALYSLMYINSLGPAPVSPFPTCDAGSTTLSCDVSACP